MINGKGQQNDKKLWKFKGNETVKCASGFTVRGVLNMLIENVDPNDPRDVIPLGHGDPSQFPCFRTSDDAVNAIVDAVRSYKFNSYSSTGGIPSAREALAKYFSRDLPYKLSEDDIFLTSGCTQAIEIVVAALARPGANILLPKPGFLYYDARCAYIGLEARHFNLLPDKEWEVDLDNVEALADENTVAMVIINPGNPCGNVYTYNHLNKIAETAKKLGILVITDEVYAHITFGSNPFVPMGVFGDVVPVITLGSISKRWVVPGWRLGWLLTNDTQGILQKTGVVDSIKNFLNISTDPATFIQGAIPQIIEKTKDSFFSKINDMLREDADICYEKLKEIPCLSCPYKPEASMFVMVKLNLSLLIDIHDDLDFCVKLAKEENMVILPGTTVSLHNWVRITFAVEPSTLVEGLERLKAFCQRHAKTP